MRKLIILGCMAMMAGCSAPSPEMALLPKADFPKPKYRLNETRPNTQTQAARMIKDEAKRQGVPVKIALAVAYVESGINPNIRKSSAGAVGVLQVMPGTARQFDPTLSYSRMSDPRINIPLGISYLKMALQRGRNFHESVSKYEAGLYSKRKASTYSRKVQMAQSNYTVLAHLNDIPDTSLNSAWSVFSPDAEVKHVTKYQHRIGKSNSFPVPIYSLVYEPGLQDFRLNLNNGENNGA